MSTTKTQVVKYIRKGDKGDPAINIVVTGDNVVFTGVARFERVYVEVYIGEERIKYYDGSGGDDMFSCSTLPNNLFDGKGGWGFTTDSNGYRFIYVLYLSQKASISEEIPFTVTVNGTVYNKKISVKSVFDGATPRGPQAWSDCTVGYNFQAGGPADEWKDVVLYNNNYYTCMKSHTKTASNYPGSTTDRNNGYWQLGDKIELVATKILLTTYELVKNLGAEAIEMKDSSGKVVFKAKGGNVTCKKGTFENVDVSGIVRAKLIYSTIKNLLVTDADHASPYYIDPVNDPCDTIFVTTNGAKWIYLPDANKYNGMEISFFQSVMTTMVYGEVYVAATNGQRIAYNTTAAIINGIIVPQKVSGVGHADTRIKLVSNEYTKLKAISGYWYVISGVVTEE